MDKQLLKKIKDYSAVAGAVLATGISADAQIVYTDIEPDTTLTNAGEVYILNLNNDTIPDFAIYNDSSAVMSCNEGNSILANSATVLISNSIYTFFSPLVLNENTEIEAEHADWINGENVNSSVFFFAAAYNGQNLGNWATGETDKYLGLRFKVEQDTLYGWARLDIAPTDSTGFIIKIKDYAYEQTPGKSIKAGDNGTVAVNELNKKSAFTVYPNPAKNIINIETELNDFDLEIIDITGRTILKAKNERMLNLSNVQKGTYIVRITSKKGEISNQRIILK